MIRRLLLVLALLALGFWLGVAILMAIIMTAVPSRATGHLHQMVIPSVYTLGHLTNGDGTKRMGRRTSETGIAHIKHFEGLRLDCYKCVAGRDTIGWGHTGPDAKPGARISLERAEALFQKDLAEAERAVNELVKVPVLQGQFDACVDFVFNLGRDHFARSTFLRLLNATDYQGAREQLMRWVHSGGQVVSGLQRRRRAAYGMWFNKV